MKTSVVAVVAVVVTASLIWTYAGLRAGAAPGPAPSASTVTPASPPEFVTVPPAPVQVASAGVSGDAIRAKPGSNAPGPRPAIVPAVDWTRYPGTLNSQIQQALQARDGVMGADLARKLRECHIVDVLMQPDAIERQVALGGDEALVRIRNERFQEYRRILANCQTVADWEGAQRGLLDMAVDQQVIGAAIESFHLGQRRVEVLHGVVRDATAGDMSSLTVLAYNKPATFGVSPSLQRSLRYAFQLAANDPEVGKLVGRYLSIAESAAVPLAGETQAHFNHDGLTQAQRAQGEETARLLIQRVKAPKDEIAKAG